MDKSEVVIRLPEPKPSSLLLKRLAPGHSHKNLTIFTPSYSDESAAAIHSAPLRSLNSNYRDKPSKVIKKSRSGHLQTKLSIPNTLMATPVTATAVPKSSVQTRFPSPPIVPSQQPAWSQYRQQLRKGIKTAVTPNFPRTSITTCTPVSKQNLTQKQKFLQPFEYLYEHIEQTRYLKTKLDDQVRRSSTLLQNFQSSNTMVESMIRNQVHETVEQHFETRLKECIERIESLEYRSPGVETPTRPVNPSATKASVKDVLTQLMNRLERIESKLDKSQNGA
ncbi:hypothetical protein K501DRAFT_56318 [Backusella circina FSU 941]|nr:hypothetical protein K501DRAFT_56318 [Backusella circina FSU 941]